MSLYSFEGRVPQIGDDSYIHPQATVIGAVTIGNRCFVGPGAVLRGDLGEIEIGDGTNIQDNCVIHADRKVVIGKNLIIGHGAIIHDVILKDRVVVGMGSIIMNGVVAEEDAIIGAGSVKNILRSHREKLLWEIPDGQLKSWTRKEKRESQTG
jgi:carbonic anhydrase/acetyltransferase-like protein (isoleucine patch superfamily)